jgi:thiamine-monophosphate kinase
MTEPATLGRGAEFDAIRLMVARWGSRAQGIGDDAATMRVPRGEFLVASVDTAVEGMHFRRGWLTPREIAYRAVAAALSDLAAMAARPIGVLLAMTIPESWRGAIDELADGVGDAVDVAGTVIRGGNLSDGAELSITTTVLGAAFAPLRRTGARIGDRVYVTGRLGAPRMATRLLESGNSAGAFRDRFAHPVPRIAEALWLADRGASAAIDISDGIVADAGHLAAASMVQIELDATRLPLFSGVDANDALTSGEEYELLLTAPTDLDVTEFERRFALPLTCIGIVAPAASEPVIVRGAVAGKLHGHDHFAR